MPFQSTRPSLFGVHAGSSVSDFITIVLLFYYIDSEQLAILISFCRVLREQKRLRFAGGIEALESVTQFETAL